MNEKKKTSKKLATSVTAVIILIFLLCVTTFALVYSMVSVDDNLFQTGEIKINLNGGRPVIAGDEYIFEPGMTVEKSFYIENQGTWDVYYRLYFENIEGSLSDVLDVQIRDGNDVIFDGHMSDLTKDKAGAANDILRLSERRELTISFHYPQNAGNSGQAGYVSFDLTADAVQTKNNPDRLFE